MQWSESQEQIKRDDESEKKSSSVEELELTTSCLDEASSSLRPESLTQLMV